MNNEATFGSRLQSWYNSDKEFARLLIILIIALIFMACLNAPAFYSLPNLQSMCYQFPEYALMSFGVMFTMILGGIDLSVVGVANLVSVVTAMTLLALTPEGDTTGNMGSVIVAIIPGVAVGAGCGFFNGLLVSKLHIPPILATLGSQQLFTGISLVLTQGNAISRLPSTYSDNGRVLVGGALPLALFIFIGVVIVLSIILNKTRYGKSIYMQGTNPTAARFSGLKNDRITCITYMISGILSGIAGLIMLANYNSAKADYGSAYQLQCILIVVLGGVNPNGGFGKIGGVTLAIIILQILSSALNMYPEISNFYRQLIWGAVLLLVLTVNYLSDTKQARAIAKASRKAAQQNA